MRKLVATVAGITLLAMPSVAASGPPAWKVPCQAVKAAKTTGKPTTPNTRNAYGKCVSAAAQAKNDTP